MQRVHIEGLTRRGWSKAPTSPSSSQQPCQILRAGSSCSSSKAPVGAARCCSGTRLLLILSERALHASFPPPQHRLPVTDLQPLNPNILTLSASLPLIFSLRLYSTLMCWKRSEGWRRRGDPLVSSPGGRPVSSIGSSRCRNAVSSRSSTFSPFAIGPVV